MKESAGRVRGESESSFSQKGQHQGGPGRVLGGRGTIRKEGWGRVQRGRSHTNRDIRVNQGKELEGGLRRFREAQGGSGRARETQGERGRIREVKLRCWPALPQHPSA